jgi:hypothetical protein
MKSSSVNFKIYLNNFYRYSIFLKIYFVDKLGRDKFNPVTVF